ncbi:MAG: prefoldin subunit alpha [Nitrososphaerales archaeon]|jgi:prefoldin alpha subunit
MSRDEDRINSLVAEVRVLENTYNELSSRQNLLERILVESRSSLETIKGLSDTASGPVEEVLVPVGGGILLRASPPKTDKVLLNIGANVVVEKTKEAATSFMEARASELEEDIVAIATQRSQIAQRLDSDRRALQNMVNRQGQ